MTFAELSTIIEAIRYKSWAFRIGTMGDGFFLQVRFTATVSGGLHGAKNDRLSFQSGRKWYLSRYMTESEVVNTALKAILTAEEHEARENFRYRGVAIYHPHIDVNSLAREIVNDKIVESKRD